MSTTVTSRPRLRAVAATSQPMKPAPTMTRSPSKPAARAACAARRPASDAPMTTSRRTASGLDPDGHHRAGVGGSLDGGAPLLGHVLLPDQHVVVAELEDVGRRQDAL